MGVKDIFLETKANKQFSFQAIYNFSFSFFENETNVNSQLIIFFCMLIDFFANYIQQTAKFLPLGYTTQEPWNRLFG